ncbi:DUF2777 domain-containing protein [Mesobacillus zeae]|uniref:DUF2777 domain-containing protein n=1 Tax=Mesobacillus zeae TaxID=1917180 RepID=A0A398B3N0_9BACI|nr:DUF2777 domain-containing protein [Mesobacillus zeae]RID84579.1 DUF2777 domain-containing protein [Mesobacillus zeae]
MKRQQRQKLIEAQARAFHTGTVEYMNKQWVFFDEETDEASLLDEYVHQEAEVLRNTFWIKGYLLEDGGFREGASISQLENGETVRIRKQLIYSLEKLVEGLEDEALLYFLNTLNSLHFSIHDSIYCYNHLTFLNPEKEASGVNFLIFDNETQICSVQHHFDYGKKRVDRFEFTLSDGKRTVIEKMLS